MRGCTANLCVIALIMMLTGCGGSTNHATGDVLDASDGGDDTSLSDQTTTDATEVSDGMCPEGFSGAGCTFCTWTTAGEACHPLSPRDLFDITAIQALSLSDLKWTPSGSQVFNGVTVLKGTFFGGKFDAYDVDGNKKTIDLNYIAAVYIPDGWPKPEDPKLAFVSAVHYEANLLQLPAAQIAKFFRIPVLYHGELPKDWKGLGFEGRSNIYGVGPSNVSLNNPCEPLDIKRGMFTVAMASADMHAITLVQRLAEQVGGQVEKVAFRGFSKEGAAAWLVAVVDPRVEVVSPGGFHEEDVLKAAQIRMESWGCYGDPTVADPSGEQRVAVARDWLLNTPAGAAYLNLFSVQRSKTLLYPRFILIDGDVGMPGMHDSYYALGSETPFLDDLSEAPWRYVRKATLTDGATDDDGDTVSKAVVPFLLVENLVRGPGSEDQVYPKVISATATIENDALKVVANASAITESMVLWWSWSDDRIWKDANQAAWTEVHLSKGTDGTWTVNPIPVPAGKVIGWYVEARNTATVGQQTQTRTDAGAVHFLRETPPITCQPVLPDWCGAPVP